MFRFVLIASVLMIVIATILPAPAAGTPEPLDRTHFELAADAAAPQAGRSYPYARCAALYRSVALHAGRVALGEARWDYARQVEAALRRKATLERVAEHGTPWPSAEISVASDVAALTRLYLARYEAMIAQTGLPWSRDALWTQDNRTCGGLLDGL